MGLNVVSTSPETVDWANQALRLLRENGKYPDCVRFREDPEKVEFVWFMGADE